MDIALRSPKETDSDALARLGRETFVDAFGDLYSTDDLSSYLDQTHSKAQIALNIANPNLIYRLIVDKYDDRLLGYCKLSLEPGLDYDPGAARLIELSQFYLRSELFGTGAADQLMSWALGIAKQQSRDEIILSVFSENVRAQKFYFRYGFEHIADTVFMVGNQADHEFLFLRKLS
ncbi:MAG: GNAT family N-acetyltransferase [Parasphingorhabdus sp.]